MVIFGKVFKSLDDKKLLQCFFSNKKETQKREMQKFRSSKHFRVFFFRERNFFLKIRRIRPSAGFGTRRRNALRGVGFAWVPDLGSFFKLLEVGFLPTLILFLF